MSVSPKDCRKNALICEDLAQRATKPEHAQVLRNLAKQWLKMAIK